MAADEEMILRLARKVKGLARAAPDRSETDSKDVDVQDDIDENKSSEMDKVLDSACADIYDCCTEEEDRDKAIGAMKIALLDFVHAAMRGEVV